MIAYPPFATTVAGSFPHTDPAALCQQLAGVLDIPAWPQLPRRDFRENMYVQFSRALPSVRLDLEAEKITFYVDDALTSSVLPFYEAYLAEDFDTFALAPAYASGFEAMLDALARFPGEWAKGQVTGPISLGLTVTDQNLRSSLYHEQLSDVIVKNTAMCARWQIQRLHQVRPNIMLFVDEPYMASFGSAFISLEREQVISFLDDVFQAIHQEGALAGVHCCGNTDWSVLLATEVDILNLDSFGFLESLALYPAELDAYLARGGCIAWGAIPNDESLKTTNPQVLADKLLGGLEHVADRGAGQGLTTGRLAASALLLPSCGLGSTTLEYAEAALEMLIRTALLLRTAH
jgi:hypothetical protein